MTNHLSANLSVRIEPKDMVRYVQSLMITPPSTVGDDPSVALAQRQWGGDTALARAAHLRWGALTRAFNDERVSTWTTPKQRDQLHVPAALIAAAGVAKLKVSDDEVVFDIPTLLDATLELCEPIGNA